MEAAAGHRHRAKAIAPAYDDGDLRDGQRRRGEKHVCAMPHVALPLDLRPDHEARRVDQREDRKSVRLAKPQESRRLVRALQNSMAPPI